MNFIARKGSTLFCFNVAVWPEYWPVWISVLLSAVVIVIFICLRKRKDDPSLGAVDMTKIDALSGVDFEKFVAELLEDNEFEHVSCTKASGDYGVDILAGRFDELYAFQCKRYNGHLGVKCVQEIYAGAKMYHAEYAVVVTNSYFTPNALKLARELGVELWDRDKLITLIVRADELQANSL